MKYLQNLQATFIFLLLGICYCWAGDITPQQAVNVAQRFFMQNGLSKAKDKSPIRVMSKTKVESQCAPFYIFNSDDESSFVIVSGDDRTNQILAYSFEGAFDSENIAPGAAFFLNWYEKQIIALKNGAESANIATNFSHVNKVLLETAKWNQNNGFWNKFCPVVNDTISPAGCSATAMAILMRYYEWPTHGYGSHQYVTNDFGISLSADFENTEYHLSEIPLDSLQSDKWTEDNQNLVAKLLLHSGIALNTTYNTTGSSGGYGNFGMFNFFGYTKGNQMNRSSMSDDDWKKILRTELDNNNPIYYLGKDEVSHAFICDGYDSEDYFHFNFGWGGHFNGYYSIDAIVTGGSNYSFEHSAYFNIHPDYNRTAVPEANLSMEYDDDMNCGIIEENEETILPNKLFTVRIYCIKNIKPNNFIGEIALFLCDKDGNRKQKLGSINIGENGWPFGLGAPSCLHFYNCKIKQEFDVKDTDRLYVFSSKNNGETWEKVICSDPEKEYLTIAQSTNLAAGKIYKIHNKYFKDKVIQADYSSSMVFCAEADKDSHSQLWRLVQTGIEDQYYIQNVCSDGYMQESGNNSQQTIGITPAVFTIKQNTKSAENTGYDISVGSYYLNCTGELKLINYWYGYDGSNNLNSLWDFEEISLSEDEINQIKSEYNPYLTIKNNLSNYNEILRTYYSDLSCSQLKSDYQLMSDQELTETMKSKSLPQILIDHALRIKNQSWIKYESGQPWEKRFRLGEYSPYSDNVEWRNILGMGFDLGSITAPTGISAKKGDILYVYIDDLPSSDGKACLELITDVNVSGLKLKLEKGLNVYLVEYDCSLYIDYKVNTHSTNKLLSDFPTIKIRIEGGYVNGYFDLTRGDSNKEWQEMQKDGLLTAESVNMRTPNLLFHMNSAKVQEVCPVEITEILQMWDGFVVSQKEMMGLTDTYIPNLSQRCNCVLNCFTTDNYYMFASMYGVYFIDWVLADILNYRKMKADAKLTWGPTHEIGHHFQTVITMAGCSELSNGLFSNQKIWEDGRYVTRGDVTLQENCFDIVGNGGSWPDVGNYGEDKDNDIKMRMYWQLYQYFTIVKGDKDFFPRLAASLRQDPMVGLEKDKVDGAQDYLKFACKVCDAAQMDLSDFFDAYGFFVPVDNYKYVFQNALSETIMYITTTQESIDSALEYMHRYPKANGNMCFIEDRIDERQPAQFEGATSSDYRQEYDYGFLGNKVGDVGQYTDFFDENYKVVGYRYKEDGNTITILPGTGAVGFKLKDSHGKTIMRSNHFTFNIPSGYQISDVKVYAAQNNGKDVEIENILGIESIPMGDNLDHNDYIYTIDGRRVKSAIVNGLYLYKSNGRMEKRFYVY